MKLLSELTVARKSGNAVIQLLHGDLSAIPAAHAVDLLVVSAFPDDYITLPGSLFLALDKKGLSVKSLAANKAVDLTSQLGCWLSNTISKEQQDQFHFKRVMCFEPRRHTQQPQEIVGNIFRCINTFAFDEEIDEIAMPLLATGYQKVPLEKMLPALLENAVFWLENGLPLRTIKLVVYSQEHAAAAHAIFSRWSRAEEKETALPKEPLSPPTKQINVEDAPLPIGRQEMYDYFISYSHVQTPEVQEFVEYLLEQNGNLNVFFDKHSIQSGGLWIKKISDAIQNSRQVICILTPDYSKSDVCWDEFQCAKLMELRKKKSIIRTINFIQDDDMPLMMAIHSYIDCTERDMQKLKAAIYQLV
ncbi:MAG: toll/interleukin-1 receptor domain-containing protein [Chitinophagaceae bacterium]|nr:toll/interleukin-1 receptor domain-containing protein [Chitinophagaceae bacterium]